MAKQTKSETPKSITVTLQSGKERLRFYVAQLKDGTWQSWAFHNVVEKGKVVAGGKGRGATQKHPSFEAAQKAMLAAVDKAKGLGWVKPAGGPGPQVDSFDLGNLPKPAATK